MSLSVWEYLRRRACEALLAGFNDALDYLERQDQGQVIHAAAKNLRKRLHELAHNSGQGNGGQGIGNTNHKPDAPPAGEAPRLPAPQQQQQLQSQQKSLPGIQGTSSPAPSPPSPAPERRKPGRPRREVHG